MNRIMFFAIAFAVLTMIIAPATTACIAKTASSGSAGAASSANALIPRYLQGSVPTEPFFFIYLPHAAGDKKALHQVPRGGAGGGARAFAPLQPTVRSPLQQSFYPQHQVALGLLLDARQPQL